MPKAEKDCKGEKEMKGVKAKEELYRVKLSNQDLIWTFAISDQSKKYASLNQKLDEKINSCRAQILGSDVVQLTHNELGQLIELLEAEVKQTNSPSNYRKNIRILNELAKQGYS